MEDEDNSATAGPLIVEGEEDLDGFFRDKDRRKKERLALKKAKAKADREAAAYSSQSAWMTQDEVEQAAIDGELTGAGAGEQQVEDLTAEDLAARMAAQAAIYRPEDDEWIDPEREFGAPITGHKKKHRNHAVAPEDDKLLQMVAPAASKLQDLSTMEKDRAEKARAAAAATTGTKGWSKVAAVEAEPIPAAVVEEPVKQPEPVPEPVKVEPEPVAAPAPAGEPAATGVYVPKFRRTAEAAAAEPGPGRSPRNQSPAPTSRPSPFGNATAVAAPPPSAGDSGSAAAAPAPGAYVPPSMRRAMEDTAVSRVAPSAGGSSRPAGSGLAAATTRQAVQAKKNVIAPDLKSADEFPTLG